MIVTRESVMRRAAVVLHERLGGEERALVFRERYWSDPALFVAECMDANASPYQEEIMTALVERGRLAVRSPHGSGKSALAAWLVIWFGITRDGLDWKVLTTASAWRHLSAYLWPEIHKWARRVRWDKIPRGRFDERHELQVLSLKLSTGAATAIASDQHEAIEGAHADHLLYVFDEAKTIPAATYDAAEGAFSGAGADTGAEAYALAISTPGAPQGRFYDVHSRKRGYEDWGVRHVSLDDAVKAKRVSRLWAKQRARQWGEQSAVYQNRVLGEFAAADEDTVIPLAWVEAAVERWQAGQASEVTAVALDVADGGADRSILAIRHGTRVDEIRDVTQPEPGMTMALAGLARAAAGGETIVVDSIGVGAGVVSRLRELGVPVVAFNAGSGTRVKDESGELGFLNKRAAAWWGLRERLHPETGDGLELPPDDELLGDLTSPRWTVTSSGKIKVESKDDIRKRINRSTDRGDAVVMVYYEEPTARGAAIPAGAAMAGGFATTTRKASRYHKTKPHKRYGRRDR